MTYSLRVTARAEADLERLYDSLVERRGPDAARIWYELFTVAVERLATRPLTCGLAYEDRDFDAEIRHLLFGFPGSRRYRALFTVRGEEVVVLTIRAPGERPLEPDELASGDRCGHRQDCPCPGETRTGKSVPPGMDVVAVPVTSRRR
jgi:plasmid stabilization system protein ParE